MNKKAYINLKMQPPDKMEVAFLSGTRSRNRTGTAAMAKGF